MRKRNKLIILRFTDEEYDFIIEKFKTGKIAYNTYSDFFLNVIKKSNINIIKVDTKEIIRLLTKSSNNINQWTRDINVFNEVSKQDIVKLKQEVENMKKEITKCALLIYNINRCIYEKYEI